MGLIVCTVYCNLRITAIDGRAAAHLDHAWLMAHGNDTWSWNDTSMVDKQNDHMVIFPAREARVPSGPPAPHGRNPRCASAVCVSYCTASVGNIHSM